MGIYLPPSDQQILLEAVWDDAGNAQEDLRNLILRCRYLCVGSWIEGDVWLEEFQEEKAERHQEGNVRKIEARRRIGRFLKNTMIIQTE